MTENRVVALRQKGAIDDPLTEILRAGARRLIAQAVEAEFETFLVSTVDLVLPDGRQRVVRHGHDPVRAIQTGIGPVEVQKPKARDRGATAGARIRFTSNILPKWARRTKSLDALLPVLYLRGISAGDFQEALAALLGKDAPNLSAAVIGRLKSEWEDEYRRWQKRDLSARHYVYVWADGVYLQARMEPQAECMLVLMGATAEGKKELIGFQTGMRESGQSWMELFVDLKARGLVVAPQAAIGDGALGFWKALDEAFPTTRHQRCWLHKTLNVLDKLPKSMQPSAHKDLREIWLSPSRGAAEAAMTIFAEKYAPKYDKAVPLFSTVDQFSTRIFPSRSGCGTFGRKSRPTRLPSRRHRRDLRSTGEPSRAGASGASLSRPFRTRPACRRQATPPSTGGFPSTNTIASRRRARRRSKPRSGGRGALSR
jgi:transposase-like protein